MSAGKHSRLVIDKSKVLYAICAFVAKETRLPVDFYLNDNRALDNQVQKNPNFPWLHLAQQLGLDRWRLYHWYFETFQRALNGSVERDDLMLMKEKIKEAMQSDSDMGRTFQNRLKTILSKEYHRSSFSISFNNMKRQVMKELGIEDKPAKLYETRISIAKQEFQFIQQKSVDGDMEEDLSTEILNSISMHPEADSLADFDISHLPSTSDSSLCSFTMNIPTPPSVYIDFIAFDNVAIK